MDFNTPILVTIILAVVGLLMPVIDALRRERISNKVYGIAASVTLAIVIGVIIFNILTNNTSNIILTNSVLSNDLFGAFFSIAMLLVSIISTISSIDYMRKTPNPAVYYSLMLLSSIGMVLIAYSTDLVMLIAAWELMSIPTYVLAAFKKRDPSSNEAAIKYFIFGALSSGLLIYGISLVYGISGSTNITVVIQSLAHIDESLSFIALLAIVTFAAGFGFKMALFPFHMWLPDTYEGSPTTVSSLLAAATKKAGFAAAIRVIVIGMSAFSVEWGLMFAVVAVLTMTIGNLAALTQKSLTRMLAYSSVAQAGYILIGLSVAPYSDLGISSAMFHVMNHAIMKSSAFIAAAAAIVSISTVNIDSFKGLGRRMPVTAIVLTISLLALAGVPPLNGFWSKLYLFTAAIDASSTVTWGSYLALAGVLNSALSLGYYGWVIRKMYFEPSTSEKVKEPRIILGVLIFTLIFMVGFGIYPTPLIEFSSLASPIP
ncbi:MAG: NADH-quinone oxidoreductase subunit N [Candidatus Nitrosocaldaceae archaeon]